MKDRSEARPALTVLRNELANVLRLDRDYLTGSCLIPTVCNGTGRDGMGCRKDEDRSPGRIYNAWKISLLIIVASPFDDKYNATLLTTFYDFENFCLSL